MVTVKVFDKNGVKTLQFLGNANEQAYDPVPEFIVSEENDSASDDTEADD